ncbi:hypothetical protein IWQ57_001210 [Coemansia nantahalensis]|uniref:Uncharacterized protein n=1 Tax=Coemansia nantahalensis TaxID=2789366 RepID=A0ACC1K5G2_9FUNG|nr:hypothetical protein IWQ57_001210 [Coemansia nantahalensis]
MRLAPLLALLVLAVLAAAQAPQDPDGAAPDPVLAALVTHAFGPDGAGRDEPYYRARFFTARLQARLRYQLQQGDAQAIALSPDDATQLNEVVGEMWLAARRLYQSWGCLSYDLALCDGQADRGPKVAPATRDAMARWEARLGTQFAAGKRLSRREAEDIHALARDIQASLLARPAAGDPGLPPLP